MPISTVPIRWAVFVLALSLLSGCAPEPEVRTYVVPRSDPHGHGVGRAVAPTASGVRMLAAIIPQDASSSWFLRLLGPAEQVSEREEDFDAFLKSIRVTGKPSPPLSWTVPAGWRVGPPNQNRVVTLQSGPADKPLEMYVSQPFGGTREANVNRWRTSFVGLKELQGEALKATFIPVSLGGVEATKVDLRGPGGGGGMGRPFGGKN